MLFIFYGIFFNLWLALIGIFLYMGAGGEKQHVLLRAILQRVPAAEAMTTEFRSLRPDEPLARSLEHIYHGCQDDFPVIRDQGIQGILTRMGIIAAIHERGVDIPVSDAMDRDFLTVGMTSPLDRVYRQLQEGQTPVAAVVEQGQLKGMLSLESISRCFMIRSVLGKRHSSSGAPAV